MLCFWQILCSLLPQVFWTATRNLSTLVRQGASLPACNGMTLFLLSEGHLRRHTRCRAEFADNFPRRYCSRGWQVRGWNLE